VDWLLETNPLLCAANAGMARTNWPATASGIAEQNRGAVGVGLGPLAAQLIRYAWAANPWCNLLLGVRYFILVIGSFSKSSCEKPT
jgi:hypothetical protein